jgi:hypothetical protein
LRLRGGVLTCGEQPLRFFVQVFKRVLLDGADGVGPDADNEGTNSDSGDSIARAEWGAGAAQAGGESLRSKGTSQYIQYVRYM